MHARPMLAAVLSTTLAIVAHPATGQTKLRVADSFPSGHYLTKVIIQPFMDEVTKRTNGAVTFEYFPAQQLGKATDMLTLTQTGVTNIGYVAPAYVSEKMPLSEAAMLPGSFDTSCEGTTAYNKVARNGAIAAQDYAGNHLHLLMAVALPPYQILTVKAPVGTEKDIQGLKLRSTGGAQDLTLRTIGAVPVRMAAPDTYESLSRGTLDGVLFPLDSVVSYNIEHLLKFSTAGANFASFIVAYSMSDASWNQLTPDQRKVFTDVAAEIMPKACAAVDQQDADIRQKLEAAGIKFTALSPDVEKLLANQLKGVGDKWAQTLDSRGRKGTVALTEFRQAVATETGK